MPTIKERNICSKTERRPAAQQVRSLHKDSINMFSVELHAHICSWFQGSSGLTPQNLNPDGLYHFEGRHPCLCQLCSEGPWQQGLFWKNMQIEVETCREGVKCTTYLRAVQACVFCIVSRKIKRLLETVQILILGVAFEHDDRGCRVRWLITLLNRLSGSFCSGGKVT